MKRQRGRNRTGGGAPSNGGGGGKPQQNVNRAFDSNGPDNVKIRGHAQHVFEKYQQLARDAFSSGDRVLAENYLQHADHYFRVLRTIQPNRAPAEILGRDVFASGLDIDFEDESENGAFEEGPIETPASETAETNGDQQQQRFDNGRGEQRYDRDNGRENNRYEGRSDNSRQDYRPDNGRQDGGQDNGRADNNRQDSQRQDGSRQDGSRQNNNRNDRYERQGQGSGQNGQGSGQETRRDYQDNGRYEPRRDGQENRPNGRYAENRDRDRDNRSDTSRNDRDDQPRDTQNRDTRRDYQEPRAQETRNEARRDYQEPRQDVRQETGTEAPREDTRDAPTEGRTRRQRAPREGRYGARTDESQGSDAQVTDVQGAETQSVESNASSRAEPQGPEAMAVIEPQAAPLTPIARAPIPVAKADAEASPLLRSQDGGFSEAPAFLQAPVASEDGEVRKPRVRRRRPKALEGAEDGGEASNVSEDA